MMRIKELNKVLFFLVVLLLVIGCNDQKIKEKRPNILFIMSDDHAAHALGCYGSNINSTPNIDRLADEGMRFTQSFCTNSVCAPSRAVILTGKYSHQNGVVNNNIAFDGSQQTIPKILQRSGYQTAMIGKWHLKSQPTGFDYWNVLPGQGNYINPTTIRMGDTIQNNGYVTDIITDETIKWIDKRDKEKPFFLMCHHKAPHGPHYSDEKHAGLYESNLPIPDNFYDSHETRSKAAKKKLRWSSLLDILKGHILTEPPAGLIGDSLKEWNYQEHFKGYLKVTASMDDNIGRLLNYLDKTGLSENTLVVYTSDNGFFLGDHGWFNKMWMYEESLRIPLLVRYPKEIAAKSINEDMVLNLDLPATFLDYAGVLIPEDIQGKSFRKALEGKKMDVKSTAIYYHYFGDYDVPPHCGIRTKHFKLVQFYGSEEWELYDLDKDPREMTNVYNHSKYSTIIKKLKQELEELKVKYKDDSHKDVCRETVFNVNHLAFGCSVKMKNLCSPQYTGGSKYSLTDGVIREVNPIRSADFNNWQGFKKVDLEAVIDLKEIKKINQIGVGFLQNQESWVFLPARIEYSISLDGKNFTTVSSITNDIPSNRKGSFKHEFKAIIENHDARFVKVSAKNVGVCPKGHNGAGGEAWLFTDEIVVK